MYWTSSSGHIELDITKEQATQGFHSGACDLGSADLMQDPNLQAQLTSLDPQVIADVLKEEGAWDATELQDHAANLRRLLWIACGSIKESDDYDAADEIDTEDEGDSSSEDWCSIHRAIRPCLHCYDESVNGK